MRVLNETHFQQIRNCKFNCKQAALLNTDTRLSAILIFLDEMSHFFRTDFVIQHRSLPTLFVN